MKILGKRFWTWMSVWAISFFVRGEMAGARPNPSSPQEATSTTNQNKTANKVTHKIPTPEFTRHKEGSGKAGLDIKKGSEHGRVKEGPLGYKLQNPKKESSKTIKMNTVKTSKWSTHSKPK